jgi:serine/threonine-protein kinase
MTDPLAVSTPADQHRVVAKADLLSRLRSATLGKYEIAGELGAGGMATVYLAHEIALDRRVAIKVMSPHLFQSHGMVERFHREARTVAALDHSNIIPIYRVEEADGLLFFVMKFVDGRALDLILKENGPLPVRTVQAVLVQVGLALAHAHGRKVIHRDVKPGNIMIDEEGRAIVTDFGIAKTIDTTSLSSTDGTVGTPYYMSPEQFGGEKITGRSDQYSLGAVVYEMLTGIVPLRGESMMALAHAHLTIQPRAVRELRPDCPPRLAAIIERMLAKTPDDRWTSIPEALGELGAAASGHDEEARAQLANLAQSGERHLPALHVPTSPIPLGSVRLNASATRAGGPRSRRVWQRLAIAGGVVAATMAAITYPWWAETTPPARESAAPPSPAPVAAPIVVPEVPRPIPPKATAPAETAPKPAGSGRPRKDRSSGPAAADTSPPPPLPPPPPPIVPTVGRVRLGTRGETAVLYINGETQIQLITSLRWWTVPAGRTRLSIAMDGCTPWDTVITVAGGVDVEIGYRTANCTKSPH